MKILNRLTYWLETHWVNPAYSGWLIGGLALFFFGAATNTMAGWLYAISGTMVAILSLAAVLPMQTLRGLKLYRATITPVSAGDPLTLELIVENQSHQPKTLLQIQEDLPQPLPTLRTAIEQIPAQGRYRWIATVPTSRRGVYRWQTVQLRTAAPLGLFWCRRSQTVKAKAVVYPTVFPLTHCPIMDELGQKHQQASGYYQSQLATEGITRTLRPYRWGDSTRLIHWRSSARYGELRVRELETYTSKPDLVIGLDSATAWDPDCFEQAITAAASLYFYALHRQLQVSLWTAETGCLRGELAVLEELAALQPQAAPSAKPSALYPQGSLLWLTQSAHRLTALPQGSRWLLWQHPQFASNDAIPLPTHSAAGILIQPEQPLPSQLQFPLSTPFQGGLLPP